MKMNDEELYRKIKILLRCQLYALSNGRELYAKAVSQLRKHMSQISYDRVIDMSKCSVNSFILWDETREGGHFWLDIDDELEELIRKKQTPWLTSPFPTFIEVDE
jgi:poly-D-alanine transfer protein DltD